jgi:predicted DsbA family dithiol-disulfide isomerase
MFIIVFVFVDRLNEWCVIRQDRLSVTFAQMQTTYETELQSSHFYKMPT